jgi:hypothetical protein
MTMVSIKHIKIAENVDGLYSLLILIHKSCVLVPCPTSLRDLQFKGYTSPPKLCTVTMVANALARRDIYR